MSIDYQARLTAVSAAISALLSGGAQSYTIDGQSVTKLDIGKLMDEERRLQGLVDRAARSTGAFMRIAPR